MKSKNIRKENIKKPVRHPVSLSRKVIYADNDKGLEYVITQNNYEAIVRLMNTNELIGVYKAAARSWKNIQQKEFLTSNVKIKVESLYA